MSSAGTMSGTKRGKGSDKGGTTTPRTLRRLKRAGDKSNGTLCRVHRHVFISQCLRVRRVHYMPYVIACCVAHARCVRVKSTHVLVSVGVLRRACALPACEEHPSARLRRLASGLPCMHVDHTTYEHTTPHHVPPNAGTPSDNDRRAAVLRQSDSMPDPLPQTFISATGVVTHFVEDKKPDHALAASIRKGRGPPDARCPCVQRFRVLRVD